MGIKTAQARKTKQAAALKLVTAKASPSTAKRPNGQRLTGLRKQLRARPKLKSLSKPKVRKLSLRQREELVISHRTQARKLARSILRKWHSRIDPQELDSVVDLSLCEAVRRYNPAFGASFITFLYYHMRGNLIRTVSDAANLNLIAVEDSELEQQANAAYFSSYHELRSATAGELAQAVGRSEQPLPDAELLRKEVAELSSSAFQKLDDLERAVIERILMNEEQLVEVARDLGYSRCHISRVKRRALHLLHKILSRSLDLKGARGPLAEELSNASAKILQFEVEVCEDAAEMDIADEEQIDIGSIVESEMAESGMAESAEDIAALIAA